MGDKQNQPFQFSFNASLKMDSQRSQVASDGGLIVVRELDERLGLGLGDLIVQHLTDSRHGENTRFPLVDLLCQSVCSRMAGYANIHDAERLSQDPTFRLIGPEKIWDRCATLCHAHHSPCNGDPLHPPYGPMTRWPMSGDPCIIPVTQFWHAAGEASVIRKALRTVATPAPNSWAIFRQLKPSRRRSAIVRCGRSGRQRRQLSDC